MSRLNGKAFRILTTEIDRHPKSTPQERVQYRLLREAIGKWQGEAGKPMDEGELQRRIGAFVPNFDRKVIQRAAAANCPNPIASFFTKLGCGVALIAGAAGFIGIANLPYPMIRRPIADKAPLLLLPSFIQMDRNYRTAIANVEQADQLIDKATSGADIDRGASHVSDAQAALDRLPVWFL